MILWSIVFNIFTNWDQNRSHFYTKLSTQSPHKQSKSVLKNSAMAKLWDIKRIWGQPTTQLNSKHTWSQGSSSQVSFDRQEIDLHFPPNDV